MSLKENKQMSRAGRKILKSIDPNIETCELPLKMFKKVQKIEFILTFQCI